MHGVGFSGADLAALVREAGLAVVREWRERQLHHSTSISSTSTATSNSSSLSIVDDNTSKKNINNNNNSNNSISGSSGVGSKGVGVECGSVISCRHFEVAFRHVQPSVAVEDRKRYSVCPYIHTYILAYLPTYLHTYLHSFTSTPTNS